MVLFERDGSQRAVPADGQAIADTTTEAYYPVSLSKFVILSVLTYGLFEYYWMYRNWAFIKHRDQSGIRPLVRAWFGVFWLYSLINDVAGRRNVAPRSVILAAGFFVLSTAWRWPEAWWLVSMFTPLPLIPVLRQINALNRRDSGSYVINSAWSRRHVVLAVICAPLLALTVATELMLVPNNRVVDGAWVWGPSRRFLESNDLLERGEEAVLFYSAGALFFAADGNLLTDRRVVSYETDAAGQLLVKQSDLARVVGIAVQQGSWLDDTMMLVIPEDGACFALRLSVEAGGDQRFIRALEARTGVSAQPSDPTALKGRCDGPASPLALVPDPSSRRRLG